MYVLFPRDYFKNARQYRRVNVDKTLSFMLDTRVRDVIHYEDIGLRIV